MTSTAERNRSSASDESDVRALQKRLWDCWNDRNAAGMAALFAEDGNLRARITEWIALTRVAQNV